MLKIMNQEFIRQLVVHTICNVTGDPPEALTTFGEIALDTRDWEQVISRLEATLDIETGVLASAKRTLSIYEITHLLYDKLAHNVGA